MKIEGDVALIDEDDQELGVGDKFQTHVDGDLHRAFSIMIINSKGQILLQQRSKFKPIAPYLWSNACCSHPLVGEDVIEAAQRRLKQEMGIDCDLQFFYSFLYRVRYGYFVEHEIDYVVAGHFDGEPVLDPDEAMAYKWISLKDLRADIKLNPEKYTFWFRLIVAKFFADRA